MPLGQLSLRCSVSAVTQQLADDLLAQPVDYPPVACPSGGCGAPVVDLQTVDHPGSICQYVPVVGVRQTTP